VEGYRRLSPRERKERDAEIVRLRVDHKLTGKQLTGRFGLTLSNISRILKEAGVTKKRRPKGG